MPPLYCTPVDGEKVMNTMSTEIKTYDIQSGEDALDALIKSMVPLDAELEALERQIAEAQLAFNQALQPIHQARDLVLKSLKERQAEANALLVTLTEQTGNKKWFNGSIVCTRRTRGTVKDATLFTTFCLSRNLVTLPKKTDERYSTVVNSLPHDVIISLDLDEVAGIKVGLQKGEHVSGVVEETYITTVTDDRWKKIITTASIMVEFDARTQTGEE